MPRDYSKLKGRLAEKGYTREKFAEAIGISAVALYRRMKGELDFKQTEIKKAAEILDIHGDEITAYFFDV